MIYLFGVYSYVVRLVQRKKKRLCPLEVGWTIIVNGHASVYEIERRLGSNSMSSTRPAHFLYSLLYATATPA